MNIIEKAKLQRKTIIQAMESVDDKTASMAPELLPRLNYNGVLVKAGTRVNWQGITKRAAVDLWDYEENNPDNAPSLWEDIQYREGYRIIPEVITVGTAFSGGEYGWWKDELYESLVDANVYTPEQYPPNWKKVEAT